MALDTDSDEQTVYDGRMSWIGAFLDWKAIITVGIWGLINRFGTRYTVTNKRVYRRRGIISKDEGIVRSADIRDVGLDQGIVNRLLRYGDVNISTAGRGGTEITFRKVGNPAGVRKKVEQVRNESGSGESRRD